MTPPITNARPRKDRIQFPRITAPAGLALVAAFCLLSLAGCGTETISPAYSNIPPEILLIEIEPGDSLEIVDTLTLSCEAFDEENQPLKYLWYAQNGRFLSDTTKPPRWADTMQVAKWLAPSRPGVNYLFLRLSDPFVDTTAEFAIIVVPRGATNRPPRISLFTLEPDIVSAGDGVDAAVQANDPEGDALSYIWTSSGGFFNPESGPQVRWFAPGELGEYFLKVTVIDAHHFVSDSLPVLVVADTTVEFASDFTTDQVTGQWGVVGLLGGLGDSEGINGVAWDSVGHTMAVTSQTNYGTYAFRLIGRNFGPGSFSCTVKVPNAQYGRIAFVPKLIDRLNYLLIGINPFQGSWQVLRCTAGSMQYLGEGWETFDLLMPIRFSYVESDNRATAMVNGRIFWSGVVTPEFQRNVPMGIGLYGLNDAQPALYDDFRVTVP